MDKSTAYQILQIPKESSEDEIKSAYIRLVKLHPPEHDPDKFIQIRKAYENLKDPAKRAREDLFTFNFIHDNFHFTSTTNSLDLNQINTEIENLDMQLQAYPDEPMLLEQYIDYLRQRAAVYVSKKLWAEAINDWIRILDKDTQDKDTQHNLFYAYNTMAYHLAVNERFEESITYWEKSLKFDPDNSSIMHNLAIAYDRIGKREESESYWKDTLSRWDAKLKQNGSDVYLKTCIVELHKFFGGRLLPAAQQGTTTPETKDAKNVDQAIHEYREVLKYDPTNFHAQMQIATAYMQENNWAEATRELAGILKNNRDNTEVLNMLGWSYLNTGKIDEAFAVWNRVLSIDPKNATAKDNIIRGHLTVGKKLRERGLYNAALVHFKSLLKYLPDKPEVHFEIGSTYAMKGDHRSAVACWQTVLQLDPKNKLARKAIAETRFR